MSMADESHLVDLYSPVQHQMEMEQAENREWKPPPSDEEKDGKFGKKCEAMSMFDEEVRLLFEETAAESRRLLELHHQRLEEKTRKELEAGLKRQLKVEQLKSAEHQQQKLEKVMAAVEKREKERAKRLTRASSETLADYNTGQLVSNKIGGGNSNEPATTKGTEPTRKRSEERQTRWRQLLVESNKQAKICREMAAEEVKQADLAVKAANRESNVESAKQLCEAKSKLESSKRNLQARYREARIFQRILEKEEEDHLERQHERDEFFAEKMATQARRQLIDAEDKLVEDRRLVELKQKVDKADRWQKMQARKAELKVVAEEKHRQLREKYRQAEADLEGPDAEGTAAEADGRMRKREKKNSQPEATVFGSQQQQEEEEDGERRNLIVCVFAAIMGFFYWLFPCYSPSSS